MWGGVANNVVHVVVADHHALPVQFFQRFEPVHQKPDELDPAQPRKIFFIQHGVCQPGHGYTSGSAHGEPDPVSVRVVHRMSGPFGCDMFETGSVGTHQFHFREQVFALCLQFFSMVEFDKRAGVALQHVNAPLAALAQEISEQLWLALRVKNLVWCVHL